MATKTARYTVFNRTFEMWFDRKNLWTVREVDVEGNQIGDADYSSTRDYAMIRIGIMATVKQEG